jgi:hypothetical protein
MSVKDKTSKIEERAHLVRAVDLLGGADLAKTEFGGSGIERLEAELGAARGDRFDNTVRGRPSS